MPQPKVRVFWDLESCPPPHSYGGSCWDLLKAIRLFTFRFGVVANFKAYWDRKRSPKTSTESLQSAMTSMGITVVDCSLVKEYSRDTLARTLAVEVLVSAIDDPIDFDGAETDIMMIFSGDKSILHPISLLMIRGYTIYLVVPDRVDQIESSRATRVFNWSTDVLDFKPGGPVLAPTLGTGQSSPAGSSAGARANSESKYSFETSGREVRVTPSRPMAGEVWKPYYPIPPPKSPMADAQHPLATQRAPTTTPMSPGSFRPATSLVPLKTKLNPIPGSSEPPNSHAPSALSLDIGTLFSTFNSDSSPSGQARLGLVASPKRHPVGPSHPNPRPVSELESANEDWGMNSGWNDSGGWETNASNWTQQQQAQPKESVAEIAHTTGMAIAHLYPEPVPGPTSTNNAPSDGPEIDDSVFLPLLQCLKKAQFEGKHQVLRSVVGAELSKNKDIYRAAGMPSFSTYVALAASRGLVTLGGMGGKDWVALK